MFQNVREICPGNFGQFFGQVFGQISMKIPGKFWKIPENSWKCLGNVREISWKFPGKIRKSYFP